MDFAVAGWPPRGLRLIRASWGSAGLLFAALGVSCSRYFVATDEADGGGHDAGGADAASVDGPAEGASTDGGSEADSPCVAPPPSSIFCDDFDHGAFGAAWDTADAPLLSLESSEPASPPRSIRAQFSPGSSDYTSVLVKKLALGGSANVRVELDLRVDTSMGDRPYPFGIVFTNTTGPDYKIAFTLDTNGVEESGSVQQAHVPSSSPPDIGPTYTHVAMSIRRAGTVDLEIGGVTYLSNVSLLGGSTVGRLDCYLRLGVFYGAMASTWDARIDNVLVTTF